MLNQTNLSLRSVLPAELSVCEDTAERVEKFPGIASLGFGHLIVSAANSRGMAFSAEGVVFLEDEGLLG